MYETLEGEIWVLISWQGASAIRSPIRGALFPLQRSDHVTPIIVWKLQSLAPLAPKTSPIVGSIVGERGPLLLSLSLSPSSFFSPTFFLLLLHHFLLPDPRHKLETRQKT